MLKMIKYIFINFRFAPFWLRSLLIITLLNIGIFCFKISLVGVTFYYTLQLSISFLILIILLLFVLPRLIKTQGKFIVSKREFIDFMHGFNYLNSFKQLKFLCYNFLKSKVTFLITSWAFGHMIFISAWVLKTQNCTMYVRVTFSLAFFIFIGGLIILKIQSKPKLPPITEVKQATLHSIEEKTKLVAPIKSEQHPFHVLPSSFWPFLTAYFTFDMLFFTVRYFHYGLNCYTKHHLIFSILMLSSVISMWFWNIIEESNDGYHTKKVRWNLLHGMMLFITSEVMLFFAIFWAFFHSSLSPSVSIYCMWPPLGIQTIFPFGLPFFNTVLLLSSGVTLTYAHRALLNKLPNSTSQGLLFTLFLGVTFTFVQGFEYIHSPFSINDSIYGSIFYFSTGFHGLHVLIGSIMLLVSLFRNILGELFPSQHVGFTSAIWYWHFVDVVWIFLFLTIYWWGS